VDSVEALVVADGAGSNVTIDIEALAGGIVSLFGGTGNDTFDTGLAYIATSVTLIGGAGNDSILGQDAADSIVGGLGDDILVGRNGADTILGNEGNNSIVGGDGADSLLGGIGNDTFTGDADNDTIKGNGGADSLLGGLGDDLFLFASSVEVSNVVDLIGGGGIDTMQLLSDTQSLTDLNFSKVKTTEVLTFANGANSVLIDTNALASGLQTIYGGTGDDTFTQGLGFANPITLIGGTGNGNDQFNISSVQQLAQNSISGGSDTTHDKISVTDTTNDNVSRTLANVTDVELLEFTAGVRVNLTGAWGIETINGGAGNSTIDASSVAYAGSGILITGKDAGADSLIGGIGSDTLQAATSSSNTNNDTLTGGAGIDWFVLGNATGNFYGVTPGATPSTTGSPNAFVKDFDVVGQDIIRLSGNGIAAGSTLNNGFFKVVDTNQVRYYAGQSPTFTNLAYTVDYTGTANSKGTILRYDANLGQSVKLGVVEIVSGNANSMLDNASFV
jgi:Ca2+-binding RTX toxin-like protein